MGIGILINFVSFISIIAAIMKTNKSMAQFKMQKKKDDSLGQWVQIMKYLSQIILDIFIE